MKKGNLHVTLPHLLIERYELPMDSSQFTLDLFSTSQEIPYGYCHCGCGEKTALSDESNKTRGRVKGEPFRFIKYHHAKLRVSKYRNTLDDFWPKVYVGEPDVCWPFLGCLSKQGYGEFKFEGKVHKAHRIAWRIVNGQLDDSVLIRHNCDWPPCCNPAHLIPGTYLDNNRDAEERGRSYHPAGDKCGKSKLRSPQVIEIRRQLSLDRTAHQRLAIENEVSISTIRFIDKRRTWKHI